MDEKKLASEVAERIKTLRNWSKLKQLDAAQRFGVGKSTWQRIEAGNLPTGALLAALSRDGYDLNWLLTGDGAMRRDASDGIDREAAEAAVLAVADTVQASNRKLSDNSVKVLFDDFYRGFIDASKAED